MRKFYEQKYHGIIFSLIRRRYYSLQACSFGFLSKQVNSIDSDVQNYVAIFNHSYQKACVNHIESKDELTQVNKLCDCKK